MKMKIRLSDEFSYKKIFRFVLPSILMMIFTSIYGVVDGFFVSNFAGEVEFASLNLIMPYVMILTGSGFMIGSGGTALVSKIYGEGDKEKANRYFTMLVFFTIILGCVLAVVGVIFVRPVAKAFGADESMLDLCVVYGSILCAATPIYMLQYVFQSFLTLAEKPRLGLVVTLIAGFSNMIFDALFIGLFNMKLVGAALATVIGEILGAVIPFIYFSRKNDSPFKFIKFKFELKPIINTLANGSSELMSNISGSVVGMLYNIQLIRMFGQNGVSAFGVLMYVQFIFVAIYVGYTVGMVPVIGYNYGSQNKKQLHSLLKKSLIIMSILGVVLSLISEFLAYPLAYIFVGKNKELLLLTTDAFHLFATSFILAGINIFVSSFFTALNNGKISALVSLTRTLIFQSSMIFILPLLFGNKSIFLANTSAEAFALILSIVCLIAYQKKYQY